MVRVGTGVSTERDPFHGGEQAARAAVQALDGARVDLVVVFASGAHLEAPEAMLEGVHDVTGSAALIGCGAGGVLGRGRELESGTAVAVWAASLGEHGDVAPFHATVHEDDDVLQLDGLPDVSDTRGVIMLSDPYTFPTDAVLSELARDAPGVPVLGGLASGRTADGRGALLCGEKVCTDGAVGVALRGVEMLPCVSQGAAPLGPEATITAAEGNVIHELAGRPALATVERIIGGLSARERALVAEGLLIGIVIDGGKPEYEQGDFLVRGVLGADRESGAVAVGAPVHEGDVIRLHARDAKSADRDLQRALRLRAQALSSGEVAGSLLFSCNGRGRAMFGTDDHDAAMVERELGGAPTAGFFAAGEIGPVGGRSFLHGFTATVAVFPS
jgi:small ligand-binding sensory domain FIST